MSANEVLSGDVEQIESDGTTWSRGPGGEFFTATNDRGDVIRARESDFIDDEELSR
jgi:hypothetical protein